MPFRERMRKAFRRRPSSPMAAMPTATQPASPAPAPESMAKRTRSQKANVYRIGEAMPPPKYPGKYDKPHQDMLRAFSFANAFGRRRSAQTDVSPMGSRWGSRKNSEVGSGADGGGGGRRSGSHRPHQLIESAYFDERVDRRSSRHPRPTIVIVVIIIIISHGSSTVYHRSSPWLMVPSTVGLSPQRATHIASSSGNLDYHLTQDRARRAGIGRPGTSDSTTYYTAEESSPDLDDSAPPVNRR